MRQVSYGKLFASVLVTGLVFFCLAGGSHGASLKIAVPDGIAGGEVIGTVGFEDATDVVSYSLLVNFSAGTTLSGDTSDFTRSMTFLPEKVLGGEESNFVDDAGVRRIRIVGLTPKQASGAVTLGTLAYAVSPTAAADDTQVLSISGEVYLSDGSVVQLVPASCTFTVSPDTDGDGMADTWEVKFFAGLDHDCNTDADQDGLKDCDEYTHGTNPLAKDSDGDGMSDGWENRYGLHPLLDDGSEDKDGDGYTNYEEYVGGSNPDDPDSIPGQDPIEAGMASVDSSWKRVDSTGTFTNPVVIVGPPTFHGSDPGVIRMQNVDTDGFKLRFQEWAYKDGWHMEEKVPYVIVESGRHTLDDGSIWEAGTLDVDGTGKWQSHTFQTSFPAAPSLFLTVQTYNGSDPVTVRAKNVTKSGFEAALFEEEAKMDGHVPEVIGYLAVYKSKPWGMVPLAGTKTPCLLQQVQADHVFTPVLSYALKLEEEKSADDEINHVDETLAVLALGNRLFAQTVSFNGGDTCALRQMRPEYTGTLEWGTVDGVNQDWLRVPLAKTYNQPVIVVKPVSYRGTDPGVIRLRHIVGDAFDLRYQEWLYKDGAHMTERVFYMVAEEGTQNLAGLAVEAGKVNTDLLQKEGWEPVVFSTPFADVPALFAATMSNKGSDPIITRTTNLSETGFDVTMDEEEARRDGHVEETLGWIAIEKGTAQTSDNRKVKVYSAVTDSTPSETNFGVVLNRRFPVILGDVSTTNGSDPCVLRYQNLSPSAVEFLLQEEQSRDSETYHMNEGLSILVAE